MYHIISRVRTDITAIKTINGTSIWKRSEELTQERIDAHISGEQLRGCCPIKEGESTTRLALLDFDSHKGETNWQDMLAVAQSVCDEAEKRGIFFDWFRSSGGKGIHLIAIWDFPQDAYSVREELSSILSAVGYANGTAGVSKGQIEIFPKQNEIPKGGCGNQFILPFSPNGQPIKVLQWNISADVPKQKKEKPSVPLFENEWSFADVQGMLNCISPDCGYDDWLAVGMALQSAGFPCSMWENWSMCGAKYVAGDCKRWNGFNKSGKSIGTLVWMAQEKGWMPIREYKALPPAPLPQPEPIKIPAVGGLVGDIADWITQTAWRPQPILSLSAALCLVGMLKGRKYITSSEAYSNLYMFNVAGTACGKEHPQLQIKMILSKIKETQRLLHPPASSTGFIDELYGVNGQGILVLDEIGEYIGGMNNKNAGTHQTKIRSAWLQVFTSVKSFFDGEKRSDGSKEMPKRIDKPMFGLMGSTNKNTLIKALQGGDLTNGLLNRFLFFQTDASPRKAGMMSKNMREDLPQYIYDKLASYSGWIGDPIVIDFTPDAEKLYLQINDHYEDKTQSYDVNDRLRNLFGRSHEMVAKVALALCNDEIITLEDVQQAFRIVEQSVQSAINLCGDIAENQEDADFIRVKNFIKDVRITTKSKLYLAIRVKGGVKTLNEYLKSLEDAGLISITEEKTKFKPVIHISWI